jgi:hypothetical protein
VNPNSKVFVAHRMFVYFISHLHFLLDIHFASSTANPYAFQNTNYDHFLHTG